MAHLLRDIAGIDPQGTAPGPDGQTPPCADCRTDKVVNARHSVVCGANGDVTRTHTHIMRLLAEAIAQCGLSFNYMRGMEPWVGKIPDGSDKYADLQFTLDGETVLADVRQVAAQIDNPSAPQAAAIVPESVLMIGDRLKMNECRNVNQQTPGVIAPYTINTETGALGQELKKLFTVLRRRTAEESVAFGEVIDGDLRVVEMGSWLQPTKADYYLQRLSVMLRQRKTAKVQGIVQRARDRLLGGPIGSSDEGFDDDEEDRVQRRGDLLANIVM